MQKPKNALFAKLELDVHVYCTENREQYVQFVHDLSRGPRALRAFKLYRRQYGDTVAEVLFVFDVWLRKVRFRVLTRQNYGFAFGLEWDLRQADLRYLASCDTASAVRRRY